MMYDQVTSWFNQHNYLDELQRYVASKSRSHHSEEVRSCAAFATRLLEKAGLDVELIETSGNPLLLAKKSGSDPEVPSILFYGHYDVQPAGNLNEWSTEPFVPEIIGDKLYGRGSADNKGQHYAHLKAIEFFKDYYPEEFEKLSIIFVLDGDEERGSFSMKEVFENRAQDFKADLTIVSDGPALVYDRPTIVGSVRGILTFQIHLKYQPEDLHSGNFGGIGRSAVRDLIELVSDLVDSDGRCKIEGFYDSVQSPSPIERESLDQLHPVIDEIIKRRGIIAAPIQPNQSLATQNQLWPTFNINGISAGGVGTERRTIIPSEATVSIDIRLVPNMDSARITELIREFIEFWKQSHQIPAELDLEFEHAMETLSSSLTDPNLQIIHDALKQGFDQSPLLVPRLGGSLPLYLFPEYLNRNVFLVPLALPDENNHAANENLDLPYFYRGMVSSVYLLRKLTEN